MSIISTKQVVAIFNHMRLPSQQLVKSLKNDYDILEAIRGNEAIDIIQNEQPQIILLNTPLWNAEPLEILKATTHLRIPSIITSHSSIKSETMNRFLQAGACNFLDTRSLNPNIVLHTTKSTIYSAAREIAFQKQRIISRDLLSVIIDKMGQCAGFHDPETETHLRRMSAFTYEIAIKVQKEKRFADLLFATSPMHDMGKVGIPEGILQAERKLSKSEFGIIKTHPVIGHSLLSGTSYEILQLAAEIAHTHHEKHDGSGYPKGISGDQIPLSGKITAVADVFDALTTKRPYKDAWPIDRAIKEIQRCSGSHFDPIVVSAFTEALPRIRLIHEKNMQ